MVEENKQILLSSVCCLCLAPKTQVALSSNIDAIYKYADIVKILLQYELIEFQNFAYNLCWECAINLKSINEFRKRSVSSYSTMVNLLYYQVLTVTEGELDKIKQDQDNGSNDICQLICHDTNEISFTEQNKIEPPVIDFIDITANDPIYECVSEENFNHIAATHMFRTDQTLSKTDNNFNPIVDGTILERKNQLALKAEAEIRKKKFNPFVRVIDIGTSHKNIIEQYLESTVPLFQKKKVLYTKGEFICKTCYEIFFNRKQLRDHRKIHVQMLVCEVCKKLFRLPESLYIHQNMEHGDSKKIIKISCQVCNKEFDHIYKFNQHVKRLHAHKYKCDLCTRSFPTEETLNKHRQFKHKVRG